MTDEPKPNGRSRKGEKHKKAFVDERRTGVAEMGTIIVGGGTDAEALAHARQRYGIAPTTARLWLQKVWVEFARRAEGDRDRLIAKQIAALDLAMRQSLGRKTAHVVSEVTVAADGSRTRIQRVVERAEPDVRSYLYALRLRAQLLGLNAPEEKHLIVRSVEVAVRQVIVAIRQEVRDPEDRARLIGRLRGDVVAEFRRRPLDFEGDADVLALGDGKNGGRFPEVDEATGS